MKPERAAAAAATRARCCARSTCSITSPCWRRSSGTKADRRRPSRPSASRGAARAVDRHACRRRSGRCRRSRRRPRCGPAPTRPAERDDLAGAHLERDVDEDAFARQALDARAPVVADALLPRDALGQVAADHRAHEIVGGEPGQLAREHEAAVAQDRDALAEREDLLEPVRDEEHGDAATRAASRRRGTAARPRPPRARPSARPSRSPCASSDSAFAISTICCSAIDSPRAIRPGSSGTPSRSKIAAACGVHRAAVDAAPGAQRLAADEDVLGDRQVGEHGSAPGR